MLTTIPIFPLSILPLPGELVPLHIFEPRYKQLLLDAETDDIAFGIFFNHTINRQKVGSVMKLEHLIKRYPSGEADIIVKCYDLFTLEKLYRNFKTKLYPGGDVELWNVNTNISAGHGLQLLFQEYLTKRNIKHPAQQVTHFTIAQELNLELHERYQFSVSDEKRQSVFLLKQLRYKLQLLRQEEKSRDVFHLN